MTHSQALQNLKTKPKIREDLRQVTHITDPSLVSQGFKLQALMGTILIAQVNEGSKRLFTLSLQLEGKITPAFTPQREFKLGKITSTIKQFYN